MKNILLLLSTIFILNSCLVGKSTKTIAKITEKTENIAKNNFGSDYKITYNKSHDFAAVSKKIKLKSTDDFNTLKIMVFNTKTNKVLWGKKAKKGSIEWISKYKLQIKYTSRENKRVTIIYNAKSNKVEYL